MTFGEYLKQSRVSKGLTQTEVAKKLGYASAQFVSNWERGICAPPEKDIKKIIRMFELKKYEFRNMWADFEGIRFRKKMDKVVGK